MAPSHVSQSELPFGWRLSTLTVCGGLAMGYVLDFDARNNIIRLTIKDRFTDEVMSNAYRAITAYVAFHPPCRGIVNFSDVTEFEVSTDAVQKLAERSPAFPIGSVRIFVCSRTVIYGMARMFQILGGPTRPDLQVAHTLDEAYDLLKAEAPDFGPVS